MKIRSRWAMGGAVLLLAARASGLAGDCNVDQVVTVDEIIVGVNIALGGAERSACPPFDRNGDGAVTIEEIVSAVNAALNAAPLTPRAFVIATDFETGSFATINLTDRTMSPSNARRRINNDAIARVFGRRVYVVNRYGGDNLQVLDAEHDFTTLSQCSTGAGSNPNDIGFVDGNKAYISLYGSSHLLIVNPNPAADCHDFVKGSIDLSAYADSDGIPEMSQVAVVGHRAYVALQRLLNFAPTPGFNGVLVIVDTLTDTVIGDIPLTGSNPFGMTNGLTVVGDNLYVSEVGVFGSTDGGIEHVDLNDNTARGFIVTETAVGGDITDFVLVSEHLAYAIVSLQDFTNALVAFDPSTGARMRTVASGPSLADIELNSRGEMFLTDRNIDTPGVRVFRAADGAELTTASLATGLPPFAISFVE